MFNKRYNHFYFRFIILIASLTLGFQAYANRITGPSDKNGRCTENLGGGACQEEREYALKAGCITQDEYNSLVGYNSYPICDRKNILRAWCSCGCFEESTRIFSFEALTNDIGYIPIKKITADSKKYNVASVKADASLSQLNVGLYNLISTTSGPEADPLIVFKTQNGLRLAVTKEHAILLADGRMVAAKNVKLTDALVLANGRPIAIKSIESLKTDKNVLNLLTSGKSNLEHTLFAEGLIVGDLAWQNNLKNMLNAIAIRQ
ncbi:Hint domain-containing protein [Fluviispira vulneris]|uniref:Hint domain-containing protein n=1 Tax=Fluviispira vulneris TaxID=2763012 RepID=UPI0016446155|nr:Hint domain-containing protein [Fluviispira vulneris]